MLHYFRVSTRIFFVLAIVSILFSAFFACEAKSSKKKNNKKHFNIVTKNKVTPEYNEAARFFAGKTIDNKSKLFSYSKKSAYRYHRRRVLKGWNTFQGPNLKKIQKWWQQYKPEYYEKTIFYPFSGPDIMNALTFFPDGEKFIMFGLEPPGKITLPHTMSHGKIRRNLAGLRRSIAFILRINFFRTNDMKIDMTRRAFNSITGVLMYFLAVNDYDIMSVRRIAINKDSNIVPYRKSDDRIRWQRPSPDRRIPGVEIIFEKNNKRKMIQYFNLNVINNALRKSSPNFVKYLVSLGKVTTILKAASYLMHSDKFSIMRKIVLRQSNFIVQDESGVPIRYFKSHKWKVNYHGYYWRPINLFANRYQWRLRKNMKKYSTGRLPFSYGYNYQRGRSHLLTIKKIEEKI